MSAALGARRAVDGSDLRVSPLCLGSNVFGWTVDERGAFEVLDAFVEAGGNFVDTADVYANWVPGNEPNSSERMIGAWLRRRGTDGVVVATKCGHDDGLSAEVVRRSVDASLERLGVETIDLLYAHRPDASTPLEETLGAFAELVEAGKVRYLGMSNYDAGALAEALAICDRNGWPRPVALQPHFNLVHRGDYEGSLAALCAEEGIAVIPYFALASGFLTGKYRDDAPAPDSPRQGGAAAYLDERGRRVLDALDDVASSHETPVAAVALAWLGEQPAVVAPIASARNPAQLAELLAVGTLELSPEELDLLAEASRA